MSKFTTSLLFASRLVVAPLLMGGAAQPASIAYAAGEEQSLAAFDQDGEDIVYVDPCIGDEADAAPAPALEANPVVEANATGIAVEIIESDSTPMTGFAVAEEPAVIDSIAIVAASGEAEQMASTTDTARASETTARLDDMNGKTVLDKNGELMGEITNVDYGANLAQVALKNGGIIGLTMEMLTELANGSVAADLTDEDAFATAEQ